LYFTHRVYLTKIYLCVQFKRKRAT